MVPNDNMVIVHSRQHLGSGDCVNRGSNKTKNVFVYVYNEEIINISILSLRVSSGSFAIAVLIVDKTIIDRQNMPYRFP